MKTSNAELVGRVKTQIGTLEDAMKAAIHAGAISGDAVLVLKQLMPYSAIGRRIAIGECSGHAMEREECEIALAQLVELGLAFLVCDSYTIREEIAARLSED